MLNMASGLKFIPSLVDVSGLIMILNTAEKKDEAIITGTFVSVIVAMLVCIQWRRERVYLPSTYT